jgi:(p)ppGpp synthase/HD superfamily hydrolase
MSETTERLWTMIESQAWYGETLALARRLHAGQVDKAGEPYWCHLERVARRLVDRFADATKAEIQAALLHDSIEDAGATPEMLHELGIESEAVEIIAMLSRNLDPAGSYLEWIERIALSENNGAIRVKLADNLDNSDPVRVAAIPAGAKMLADKYAPARSILERALATVR